MPPGSKPKSAAPRPLTDSGLGPAAVLEFRGRLRAWYRAHARPLPWRGVADPYRVWVSEIMLQQTRVAAVLDHYARFVRLFPTVAKLAAASEDSVLAAWSGLGYYRRARMLHKAAQAVAREMDGVLPRTAAQLRGLPGVGEYTAAAIASISFGESVPVVDGNVERVILRVTGCAEVKAGASRAFVTRLAATLVPPRVAADGDVPPGDHNQAMMELGATVCLPRAPRCRDCPVFEFCRTRGEHTAPPRAKQLSRNVAYLFATRRNGATVLVLLEHRDPNASLMPAMLELPPLPLDSVAGREPILRLRHSITDTNYYVEIFAEESTEDRALRRALPAAESVLAWHPVHRLDDLPLTGLARKALKRLDFTSIGGLDTPAQVKRHAPQSLPRPTNSIEVRAAEREAAAAAAEELEAEVLQP